MGNTSAEKVPLREPFCMRNGSEATKAKGSDHKSRQLDYVTLVKAAWSHPNSSSGSRPLPYSSSVGCVLCSSFTSAACSACPSCWLPCCCSGDRVQRQEFVRWTYLSRSASFQSLHRLLPARH